MIMERHVVGTLTLTLALTLALTLTLTLTLPLTLTLTRWLHCCCGGAQARRTGRTRFVLWPRATGGAALLARGAIKP